MYNAIIIGGGAAGLSCSLVLGSAVKFSFVKNKKIGVFTHQKTSDLQNALFNNVLGLKPGTTGADILKNGKTQLANIYPHIEQFENEKVILVKKESLGFQIKTNKNIYYSEIVIIAVGYTNLMTIKGLEPHIQTHPRANKEKNRIWLKNKNHLIEKGLYVAGTLAGWRSQFAIASGSGAQVATDILTLWNNGKHTKVHDKVF